MLNRDTQIDMPMMYYRFILFYFAYKLEFRVEFNYVNYTTTY